MKVAVIYPEVLDMARYRERRKEFPPFGALYIAAAIEAAGHTVRIVKLSPSNLTPDLSGFEVIAFSISASATFNMFLECRRKSRIDHMALLLAGGVHANLFPEQTLIDLDVDVVGIGEGEETIIELLDCAHSRDFSRVQGICFRRGYTIFRTPARKISKDIDKFLFPARHLLPVEDFVMNDRMSDTNIRMTHVMPGRGCPFPCRYCASAQTSVQYRSGDNLRRELLHLVERYEVEGFAVVGNDFILSKRNVGDICASIEDLGLKWATLSRVDRVDADVLAAMKRAGCYEIEFGVESGSQRILNAMDKRASVDQIRNALRLTYEAGIKSKVFLVHGYPGEDSSSVSETIALLDEIGHWITRVSLFRFVPLPGTYVYKNAAQFDLRGTDQCPDWEGDWGKYHIHHNHHHWWGSAQQFEELSLSFLRLQTYVEERWPSRFSQDEVPLDRWQDQRAVLARSLEYHSGRYEIAAIPAPPAIEHPVRVTSLSAMQASQRERSRLHD
ncbi:B12-binding domain-containing radical SAM protein [Burkholderia stagnalis]